MQTSYDAVIIGTGQAGKPLAVSLANAGWKTAIVERDHVGGTCVNYGCTPTKTMVASARVAYTTRRAAEFGVGVDSPTINFQRIRDRKRRIVTSFRSGSQNGLEQTPGLDLIFGDASFLSSEKVRVEMSDGTTRELSANKFFINTGTRPRKLDLPGIQHVEVLDSTSIMEINDLPTHLIVIGGGYVGLEFAQMFLRFGSRVTVFEEGPQLLGREDEDVSDEVRSILVDEGANVLVSTSLQKLEKTATGIALHVSSPTGDQFVSASHILTAAGRVPNTDTLHLALAGVDTDPRGFISVNGQLETSSAGIFALGDVNGGPAFTHVAYDDFRIVHDNLLEQASKTTEGRLVPYTVFIDPQLGRVGMTEAAARRAGKKVRVAKLPMTHVARALEVDETRGFMKAIVDADTGLILGAAILGIEGGEIMSCLQMAMMGDLDYRTIRDGVFAHPTLAESLNNLFMTLDN